MKHPDEDILELLALDPKLVKYRKRVEAHVARCVECRKTFDAIRAFDAVLAEPETWLSVEADDSRAAELQRFAVRAAAEDDHAVGLLKEFESADAAGFFVWTDIPAKPQYRTGGVARRLCTLANAMCERQPLYAVKLAEAAVKISGALADATYPRRTIHELRGEAWKEQANAHHHLGEFEKALTALAHAEAEYAQGPYEGLGLVAVQYVRAAVLFEREQFDAADGLASEAAAAALRLGDRDRYMRARHLQGEIRVEEGRLQAAAELFAGVLAYGQEMKDRVWIARESLALGVCHVEMSNKREAGTYLYDALRLFGELGFRPGVARTKWCIARLEFLQGNASQGIHRLHVAMRELAEHGLLTDSALAALDLAEMLNIANRSREIVELLAGVVRTFTEAGKLNAALTALAYLKESVASGRMTPPRLKYVRKFLVRVDRQPELLFAPPPADPV